MENRSLRHFLVLVSTLTFLSATRAQEPGGSRSLPPDPNLQPVPNDNTELTFSDDFKGPALDARKWNAWVPWTDIINQEKQAYVLDAFEFLPGGGLRIKGEQRTFGGQSFTSGELATCGKFSQQYGYWEMVARVPRGNGFWPAFWIIPQPTGTNGGAEIDVMEILCEDTHTVHTTLHYTGVVSGRSLGFGQPSGGADFADGYHSYAVSWRPQVLVWLVDGKECFRIEGSQVPAAPEYLIANLAIGGSWPKPVDATTPFPAYMDIKSIKVYQYKDLAKMVPTKPLLATGPTTVTPAIVKPGDTVDLDSSFTTTEAYPNMHAAFFVTDFNGKKFFAKIDKTFENLKPGTVCVLHARYAVPNDLPAGVYSVPIQFVSESPKLESWFGCAVRFEVSTIGTTDLR